MTARRRAGGGGGAGRPHGLPWHEIHPTLDLHGDTADEARVRAERWLRERRREGVRVVRIVTGKGLHSAGPPVLPGEIADLLRRLHGSVVAGWEGEAGGGAYRVELRRPETAPGRQPAGKGKSAPDARVDTESGRDDPELRRRAEESLAGLGITPTPALLTAEMRRLAREGG